MACRVPLTLIGPRVNFVLPPGPAMAYRDSVASAHHPPVILLHGGLAFGGPFLLE